MITKLNNKAVANVTSIPVALGDMVLVSSATASSSASIEFSLGNYKEYKFYFVNIHPQTGGIEFEFQCSTDGGSTYATTITSTSFLAYHYESDVATDLTYITADDQANGTSFQRLIWNGSSGNNNDECLSGTLQLFNPSSTTYVKHFMSNINTLHSSAISAQCLNAGYFNDTNDLTNIKFRFSSGNIDDGKILMFGIN